MTAITIIVVHAWLFTGGFGGFEGTLANRAVVRLDAAVSLFFLLSAFLLYRPMIASRAGGPDPPAKADYLKRRFLRIYPAYWVALTGLAVIPGIVGVFGDRWWAFYTLLINYEPIYGAADCAGQRFLCGLPQTWTLTTEISFYLVLPLYAAFTGLLARRLPTASWMRAELVLLGVLAGASVLLNVPFRDDPWFRFSFAGHFLWLALGLGLAVLSVGLDRRSLPGPLRALASKPLIPWGGAAAVYIVTVLTLPPEPFIVAQESALEFIGTHLAHSAIAVLLLIPVFFGDPNARWSRALLGNRLVMWLGLISYGLFLWHVTIAYQLGVGGADAGFATVLVGTVVVAVPLAAASYYLIERPLMRFKYRRIRDSLSRRRPAPPSAPSPDPVAPA